MKILIATAALTASTLFGSAAADTVKPARPDILGCKGMNALEASVQRDPAGNMIKGQPQDAEMAAALIASGDCFALGKAVIKDMKQYRYNRARVMAIVPGAGAQRLWVIYQQLYGQQMDMDLQMATSQLPECQNDCRD